jgi:hypothetical protein
MSASVLAINQIAGGITIKEERRKIDGHWVAYALSFSTGMHAAAARS